MFIANRSLLLRTHNVIGHAHFYANIKSHRTLWKPHPGLDPSLTYIETPYAGEGDGGGDESAGPLHVGVHPPLLEVEGDEDEAAEISPVPIIPSDLGAVPAFGLK